MRALKSTDRDAVVVLAGSAHTLLSLEDDGGRPAARRGHQEEEKVFASLRRTRSKRSKCRTVAGDAKEQLKKDGTA